MMSHASPRCAPSKHQHLPAQTLMWDNKDSYTNGERSSQGAKGFLATARVLCKTAGVHTLLILFLPYTAF